MDRKADKFNIVKNGYDKEEVDGYVAKLSAEFEEVSGRQKERIFELKNQLTAAENKLKAFNQMSGRIGEALSEAVSKAEQIEKYSMQKLQFEIEQLKAFHERWQEYYQRIMQRYPLDEDLEGVGRFNATMTRILSGADVAADEVKAAFDAQHSAEAKRITKGKAVGAKRVLHSKDAGKKKSGSIAVSAYDNDCVFDESIDGLLERIINSDTIDEQTANAIRAAADRFDPIQKIDDYYKASGGEPSGGFNLKDALNPKQSLEDILRDLGVGEDE